MLEIKGVFSLNMKLCPWKGWSLLIKDKFFITSGRLLLLLSYKFIMLKKKG